jgi:Mn2+/Fe2+ NRAMP family transporter
MDKVTEDGSAARRPWWKSIGPALITACVVFGPGSLLISSNVGANHGYELLWLLVLTALLMGTYLTMGARIGVCGGATPCTLAAQRLGRPAAFVIGLTLCLICSAFQFSNNLAVAIAAGAFFPKPVLTLTSEHLSATDPSTDDASLVFTVKSSASSGQLKNDDQTLKTDDTFTQADIAAGNIRYVHTGINAADERVKFTVANTQGNETGENTFSIRFASGDGVDGADAAAPADDGADAVGAPIVGNHSATMPRSAAQKAVPWILIGFNLLVILFLFAARQIYTILERAMKVMVGVIIACFAFNLLVAQPAVVEVLRGFTPHLPEGIELALPKETGEGIVDPMILIAGLLGTTFSVAGAFFQGNLVREKNWTVKDYEGSVGDAIAGVCVLTGVSMIIMITAATVIRGQPATDIGTLALSLKPLLGVTAYSVFCIGLVAVAMNPFLINAMIGGTILADGAGANARMKDRWPRILTVVVMIIGMGVALLALRSGQKPVNLIIFGQALTVLGNPLMAITMLWLANRKDVMGDRRNGIIANILGAIGLVVVVLMAARVLWLIVLKLT